MGFRGTSSHPHLLSPCVNASSSEVDTDGGRTQCALCAVVTVHPLSPTPLPPWTVPGIIASTQCMGSWPCKRWVCIARARPEASVDLTLALGSFCFRPRRDV